MAEIAKPLIPGPLGPQGIPGRDGVDGQDGLTGAKGDPGIDGGDGADGFDGDHGHNGLDGLQGEPGPIGPTGIQGPEGQTGPIGLQGDPGPIGLEGIEGPTGPDGGKGLKGPKGSKGDDGKKGDRGSRGEAFVGPPGEQGDEGPDGPQGPQGDQGIQGPQGDPGTPATPNTASLPLEIVADDIRIVSTGIPNANLFSMLAGTMKANVTGIPGLPTDHSLATLSGSGLDYALGVMSVDFSSVTYTADEDTLTLAGLEFSINASGVDTTEMADGAITPAKMSDIAPGTVLGNQIDAATQEPQVLNGNETTSLLRRRNEQEVVLAPGLGSGAGGVYIASDIAIAETTHVLYIQVNPAGVVEIAGLAGGVSIDGREIDVELADNVPGSIVRFLNESSIEPSSSQRFISTLSSASSSVEHELRNRGETATFVNRDRFFGNNQNRWKLRGGFRQLVPNDIDSSVIVVDALSVLDQFKSGDVITLPDRKIVIIDGQFTFPANTRIVLGDDSIFRGYGRARDSLTFSTPAESPFVIPATPGSTEISNLTITQTSATADVFILSTDATSDRFFVRNLAMVCGGRDAMSVSADVVDMSSVNIIACASGIAASGNGTVFVIADTLIVQTVGGSGNGCVDFGTFTFQSPRLSDVVTFSASGGNNLNVAASNANFPDSSSRGEIDTVNFQGAGTALSNDIVDDLQWVFSDCEGIKNSHFSGGYSLTGNATATVIATQGVFVKVAGTTVEETVHRMSMTASNEMTIDRLQEAPYVIHAQVSANKTGGATQYSFGLFKNDVLISPPMIMEVTTVTQSIGIIVIADLMTDDVIDVKVRNDDNTNNLTVINMSVVISEG